MDTTTKEENLFQEYVRTKNPELESKIVEKYLPFAKMFAYNQAVKAGKLGDFDDFYSDAALGLLNAIRNYDLQEGVKFETYATYKIRGAILDGVRKNDWVPRTARQKQKAVNEIREKLRIELGRVPFMEEIANAMDMGIDEYRKMLAENSVNTMQSLDAHLEENGDSSFSTTTLSKLPDPEKEAEKKELAEKLGETLEDLSERERLVIQLYYYEELSFIEIANVLNVSQPRVSQLHTRALSKMRPNMGKYMGLFTEQENSKS